MAKESVAVKEEYNCLAVLPYAYYELANVYVDRGELKLAEKYYRRSIEIIKKNGGEYLFLVLSRAYLAQCLSLQGRLVEARSAAEEVLTETRRQMNYIFAISRGIVGPIMVQSGKEKEGLRMLKRAIKIFTKIGAKYPLCFSHGCLAGFLIKRG